MITLTVYGEAGLHEAIARFYAGMAALDVEAKLATLAVGNVLQRAILPILWANEPVRTGMLRQSTSAHLEGTPGETDIVFTTDAPYARYVLEGTRPHQIVPRQASVLAFDAGGEMIFTKRVNHPGTKANDFVERTMQAAVPVIDALVETELDALTVALLGEE